MKKSTIISTLLIFLIFSACSNQQSQINPSVIISMQEKEYIPSRVTIKKGGAVRFVNDSKTPRWPASNIHPTHAIYSKFDARKPITTGSSWTFVFKKNGIWRFHDHLFPEIKGVITVE